jgi:2-polyprenyl-3-methyl-5-hydroxy-6-metoxy-1,4-benzoquinol methylase
MGNEMTKAPAQTAIFPDLDIPGPRDLAEAISAVHSAEWFARATRPQPRRKPLTPVIQPSDSRLAALRSMLLDTYFKGWSTDYAKSAEGLAAVDVHAIGRYNDCVLWIVPWVARHIDLSGKHLIDLGCGTGSSTAAFAGVAKTVVGYDIESVSVEAARHRSEVLGLRNTSYVCEPPATLLDRMKRDHSTGVDAILCYAVLEHQTFGERTQTLKTCWELLRPGGVFIIADTPNRLTYNDTHTSLMPFFHTLPHEVAVAYASKSPRKDFTTAIEKAASTSAAAAEELLIRWGRGVSFHDFELALGDVSKMVVGDGFDPEILDVKPLVLEEMLLGMYAMKHAASVPPGFFRRSVDVVLMKPKQ